MPRNSLLRLRLAVLSPLLALVLPPPARAQEAPPAPAPRAVEVIRTDAAALEPFAKSPEAKRFLLATADLPEIQPRTIHHNDDFTRVVSDAAFQDLPEAEREGLKARELDEGFYYNTRYGSPLAYVRALDLVFTGARAPDAAPSLAAVAGKRILDFGYGGVGHLRLLASLGADAVGVEVDPLLPALYSEPGDTGKIAPSIAAGARVSGRVSLAHGRWPAESAVVAEVGDGYDLILSKNTLKNGYINPEREVSNPRMLIDLGVDHETFVANVFRALNPGGVFIIYNLSPPPAPPDKPYIPWADGRSPFSRETYEAAGFEILAFDVDDSVAAREMASLLGWDKGARPMNPETDLFAHYTILRKPE